MATVVNDLVTKFGFSGSISPLALYNTTLGKSIVKIGVWTGLIVGATAAFDRWADSTLSGVDALDALSKRTKISVATIQELSYAAEQTQSTAGAMQSTLQNLSRTIGNAAQKGSEDFARLGISVRTSGGHIKSADQILYEVGGRLRSLNLSLQEQETFASALGIDPTLIQLLNKSSGEFDRLRRRARAYGVLTAKQAAQAASYKRSINGLWFGLNSLQQLIAIAVAPQLKRMAESFARLLRENKKWIIEGARAVFKWMGKIWDAFVRMLPVLKYVAAGFAVVKLAMMGVGGVIKGLGFVALLLVLDDLITAFRGGKSVIRDFFQESFNVDIVVELTKAFDVMSRAISTAFGWLKSFFNWLNTRGAELGKSLAVLELPGWMETAATWANDLGTSLGKSLAEAVYGSPEAMNWQPAGAVAGAALGNQTVEQHNTINVYASDPLAAGEAVQDNLNRQLDNANAQINVGGR